MLFFVNKIVLIISQKRENDKYMNRLILTPKLIEQITIDAFAVADLLKSERRFFYRLFE